MMAEFFTIGFLMLLSSMLPGPDFAMVTKNTVMHSRTAGIFTSLGIASAILVHVSYCILGLAVIITRSLLLFSLVKYIGASYLVFIGIKTLISKKQSLQNAKCVLSTKTDISIFRAWRQGFLCNLLNPKATLFFLALFTMIIKPNTPIHIEIIYAAEMFIIIFSWFALITMILSHPIISQWLDKAQTYISKTLGVMLIGFGICLAFVKE